MNSQPAAPAAPPSSATLDGSDSSSAAAASATLSYELVLPAEELGGIYDRIVKHEIKMRGEDEDAGKPRRPPQVSDPPGQPDPRSASSLS